MFICVKNYIDCRELWTDEDDWLHEGQHGFRLGYSSESQVVTVCQDIADSLDNEDRIDTITNEREESVFNQHN